MRGEPLAVRLASGLRRPTHAIRGMDVAGTVAAVGKDVIGLEVGDEVVGEIPGGGLAPWTTAPAARLVPRIDLVPPVAAAALPLAGGSAWQALERADVPEGGRVLVIGASGGVGHFAVQLAVHRGAEGWALTGACSAALVEHLGAAHVFDYARTSPGSAELPDGAFDAVIDIAGTAPLRVLRRLVRRGGRVVLVAGEGGRVLGPAGRMLGGVALSLGSGRGIRPLLAIPRPDVLRELLALLAAGEIRPVIERCYPLADAPAALAHIDAGHTIGKIVVLAE